MGKSSKDFEVVSSKTHSMLIGPHVRETVVEDKSSKKQFVVNTWNAINNDDENMRRVGEEISNGNMTALDDDDE